MISIKNVSKVFFQQQNALINKLGLGFALSGQSSETIHAVKDVSFTAHDGQITGLLGPNGSGKSTTLRSIYGVMTPTAGEINIDGVSMVKQPLEAKQRLGVFPDEFGLYEYLTPIEHCHYFGDLYDIPRAQQKVTLEKLTEQLGMADILHRRCQGFSAGQRMKVALACALIHDPKNIILDEPSRGLDVMSLRSFRQLLERLKADGHCILFSSHIMPEVASLCDRVVIIDQGQCIADTSPDALIAQTGQANFEEAFISTVQREQVSMSHKQVNQTMKTDINVAVEDSA